MKTSILGSILFVLFTVPTLLAWNALVASNYETLIFSGFAFIFGLGAICSIVLILSPLFEEN